MNLGIKMLVYKYYRLLYKSDGQKVPVFYEKTGKLEFIVNKSWVFQNIRIQSILNT